MAFELDIRAPDSLACELIGLMSFHHAADRAAPSGPGDSSRYIVKRSVLPLGMAGTSATATRDHVLLTIRSLL